MTLKRIVTLAFLAFICGYASCRPVDREPPVKKVHQYVKSGLDSLYNWIVEEFIPLVNNSTDSTRIRQSFAEGRKKYKKVEFAIEYFYQNSSQY